MNLSSILQAPNNVVDSIVTNRRFSRNEDMDTHVQLVDNTSAVSMFLLDSEFPFQTVDDALNACL
jgi:hypothetical protein